MGLLLNSELDDGRKCAALLVQGKRLIESLVPLVADLVKPLPRLRKKEITLLLLLVSLLKLFVLLDKEHEPVLHVLVALLEYFVVLREIIDEVLHEVEFVAVEGGQLDGREVSACRLRLYARLRCRGAISLSAAVLQSGSWRHRSHWALVHRLLGRGY